MILPSSHSPVGMRDHAMRAASEKSSEGFDSHEADKACHRLNDSFIPGVEEKMESIYIIDAIGPSRSILCE